jgi:anaerobic magnesium-protoporphyrin IX monomethyl ester cyclase
MSELNVFAKPAAVRPMEPDADSKHLAMLQAIAPYAKSNVQKGVTQVEIIPSTKNTKLLLLLLPEWATMFPPFNMARLSAVAKGAGYESKCIDLNVKAYNYMKENDNCGLDYSPWEGAREWKWVGQNYYEDLHERLEPLFTSYIEQIVEYAPDVIGFTTYYCNYEPTSWMASALKKVLPNAVFVLGGSDAHKELRDINPAFNYIVRGEGEGIILDILDNVEKGIRFDEMQILQQPEGERLNISGFPTPDYSHFDFNEYQIPNGVNSELSRGCVAKCTFCEETHFWKYRQRQALDILTELRYLYYEKGTDVVWFIDSLVNGNLSELMGFCKGVIAAGMKIHWTGYCRCDGRMDLEFYQMLADSGCAMLNYGIESGSQRVLDDMDKKVTVAEMEQNFRDGAKVGVAAFTNWIVGFPTEQYQDFADTLTFLWRNRNMNIISISPGFGFGLGMNTVAGQNPDRFNILDHKYLDGVITKDFRLSKFHILNRMKSFFIFVQNLITENPINIPQRPNIPMFHYTLEYVDPTIQKDIDYEQFDYEIIKPNISPFADSLVNEMFVLFRMLWRTRGGFHMTVKYDEELDMMEFGGRNAGPYWATHDFKIDHDGNWECTATFKFVQPPTVIPDDPMLPRSPFFAQDYSRETVNAAKRARKLAKPKEWGDEGRDHEQFMALIAEEKMLNETINFTFDYEWSGSGKW